jgi:hypothetical protein
MRETRAPETPPYIGLGRGSRVGQRFSRPSIRIYFFARNVAR